MPSADEHGDYIGRPFGGYTVTAFLGAGGMGEVYRAHDATLGRDVALKILPTRFAVDAGRRARLDREARVLAALSHPAIGAIFGVVESDGRRALVLELVDGPTLADLLLSDPPALKDAIGIARQIVEALAEAHEKSIVHRDLKPANIKVTPSGAVKVLDFGLAKLTTDAEIEAVDAVTLTAEQTRDGSVVGTPAYMSPEQARGKPVDKRTDIWAFGCVLYEMLTGRRPFSGETTTDIVAAILERDPDFAQLPARTPQSLRRLLTRCLEKDPRRRLHDIADARFDLEESLGAGNAAAVSPTSTLSRPRRAWPFPVSALALLVAVGVGWALWPRTPDALPAPRVVPLTTYQGIENTPSFSPDATQVAFSWDGTRQDNDDIYIQAVGTSEGALRLTRDPARDLFPAWSPDGANIAFVRREPGKDSVYIISPLGQGERKLADFSPLFPESTASPCPACNPSMLDWSPDGRWIVVGAVKNEVGTGLFGVAIDGTTRLLLRAEEGTHYRSPAVSPKGNLLAYGACRRECQIEIAPLDSTFAPTGTPRRLKSSPGSVLGIAWVPDGSALFFGQGQVGYNPWYLWRVPASGDGEAERVDMAGIGAFPTISRRGDRMAYSRRDYNMDLWMLDGETRPRSMPASSTFADYDAALSPDGSRIAFTSDRVGLGRSEIYVANADGSGLRSLTKGAHAPEGSPRWSPDGRHIAFDGRETSGGPSQVFVAEAAGGAVRPLTSGPSINRIPSWSNDGRWLYVTSNRTGRLEVWRIPVAGGEEHQVTPDGGSEAIESVDGKLLYFRRTTDGSPFLYARPAAGGPVQRIDSLVYWNYWPVERGVIYVARPDEVRPPYTYTVKLWESATGTSRVVSSFQAVALGPSLTATRDGKTILLSGVTSLHLDLMLIENLR